jgi:anthranilate phosphoribosyltransferase
VLNAAAALLVAWIAPDLAAGVEAAVESLDRGAATGALDTLVRVSRAAHAAEGEA